MLHYDLSTVKDDQNNVASAQAKADKATLENINKAKNAISDQQEAIVNDQTAIKSAQSAVDQANVQGTITESTATKPITVSADKVAVQSANNNSQSNSAELPQTGNNNNEILAFIVLALASALSFLGIGKRQHN